MLVPDNQPTVLEYLVTERTRANSNLSAPWDPPSVSVHLGQDKPAIKSILRPLFVLSDPAAEPTWNALTQLDVLLSDGVGPLPPLFDLAENPLLLVALAQARAGTSLALARVSRMGTPSQEAQRAARLVCENTRRSLSAMGLSPSQVSAIEVHAFSETSASLALDTAITSISGSDNPTKSLLYVDFGEVKPRIDWGSDALNFEAVLGVLGRANYATAFSSNFINMSTYRARQKTVDPGSWLSQTAVPRTPDLPQRAHASVTDLAQAYTWLARVWRFEPNSGLNL